MEEECKKEGEVTMGVVVFLLYAKNAWPPEGIFQVSQGHFLSIPRVELELEQVLDHHHQLKRNKVICVQLAFFF